MKFNYSDSELKRIRQLAFTEFGQAAEAFSKLTTQDLDQDEVNRVGELIARSYASFAEKAIELHSDILNRRVARLRQLPQNELTGEFLAAANREIEAFLTELSESESGETVILLSPDNQMLFDSGILERIPTMTRLTKIHSEPRPCPYIKAADGSKIADDAPLPIDSGRLFLTYLLADFYEAYNAANPESLYHNLIDSLLLGTGRFVPDKTAENSERRQARYPLEYNIPVDVCTSVTVSPTDTDLNELIGRGKTINYRGARIHIGIGLPKGADANYYRITYNDVATLNAIASHAYRGDQAPPITSVIRTRNGKQRGAVSQKQIDDFIKQIKKLGDMYLSIEESTEIHDESLKKREKMGLQPVAGLFETIRPTRQRNNAGDYVNKWSGRVLNVSILGTTSGQQYLVIHEAPILHQISNHRTQCARIPSRYNSLGKVSATPRAIRIREYIHNKVLRRARTVAAKADSYVNIPLDDLLQLEAFDRLENGDGAELTPEAARKLRASVKRLTARVLDDLEYVKSYESPRTGSPAFKVIYDDEKLQGLPGIDAAKQAAKKAKQSKKQSERDQKKKNKNYTG